MKKIITVSLVFTVLFISLPANALEGPPINARSAILMEAETGKVLFEHNADEQLPPASITKIMTMLLTMEAIDSGKITFDDKVCASERAREMGGSTIFLDAGEEMSVHDLLKGVAVASGNDAAVALGEYIAGSEAAFIDMMNSRAAALSMNNTHFLNTNGLDADGHFSSARDIAIMSRELLKHKKIFDFTTIWTDSLRGGKTELANTNKLIRFYRGANGLKTGSTSKALYCLSATAMRDDMQLIAVVMAAPTTKDRFDSARALLDFGFANYSVATAADKGLTVCKVPVEKGITDTVDARCRENFTVLVPKGRAGSVTSKLQAAEKITAPVKMGDKLGKIEFFLDGKLLGETELIAAHDVEKKGLGNIYYTILRKWLTLK